MLTEKRLIRRARQGCTDSMRQIYEMYASDMLTLANALLNDIAAAEDVVHDVFVKFAQTLDDFRLRKSLKAYFATCTRNLARDRMRTKKRHADKLPDLASPQTVSTTPADHAQSKETVHLLRAALQLLPIEQREALLLKTKAGLTFKQIAEIQDVSANTVQGRYRYGLDKLRSLLDSEVQK